MNDDISIPLISQAEALELFSYDSDTGDLRWRISRSNRALVGAIAGSFDRATRYICIRVKNRLYYAHRIIWLMKTGKWPDQIDHINHDRADNCWRNLRNANSSVNGKNKSLSSKNSSGQIGVHWHKAAGKWEAQIKVQRKSHWLGLFVHFDDAVAARKAAERQYGFHPNHGAAT